jgi:uncharacterized membrane protein
MRYHENQQYFSMLKWCQSILTSYFFSCDLIPTYCFIDSQMTSSQHTNVLLILMVYHSSILICYWFTCDLIPAYWCVIHSMLEWGHMKINNILVYWNEVTWESITNQYGGMRSPQNMVPHSTILMCYWFSCDLIPAYWSIVDSHGTSFHHTNVLLILMQPHSWNEVAWESITHEYGGESTIFQYAGIRSHENQ